MSDINQIVFSFSGKIANNHEMNFYENSRFMYGASRLIYTVEEYRQNKRVVEKLRKRVNIDLRVRAAQAGSFEQEVLIYAAPIIADCAIKAPLDALLAYILDRTFGGARPQDSVVSLAKEYTNREREKTRQSEEETKRIQSIEEITSKDSINLNESLNIIDKLVDSQSKSIEDKGSYIEELRSELLAAQRREKLLRTHSAALEEISSEEDSKLISQTRNAISEVGVPLRTSADVMSISSNFSDGNFVVANENTFRSAMEEKVDDLPISLQGTIKMYDRETGNGRFRSDAFFKPMSFHVPVSIRKDIRSAILQAMNEDICQCYFYFVRDKSGSVKRLLLSGVETDVEE